MLPRVLALIQAGGQGSRMDVLTRECPKPLLPFAGTLRLIDIPLSNLRNSAISDVGVSVQYQGQALVDALAHGRPWDLDRTDGGLTLIIPEEGSGSPADEGFVSGNAEELLQNRDLIRRYAPDVLLVLSADHVYRLDYREVVEEHLAREAECTVVTTEVSRDDASHHATVETDREGRVTRIDYKPEEPTTSTVATEIFVYHPDTLIRVLEDLHRRSAADQSDGATSALGDFGELLLPALVERGWVYARPLPGYWRDLGRPDTYFRAHQELLAGRCDLFDDPHWVYRGAGVSRPPAWFGPESAPTDSLISAGAAIHGRVRRSVLGPGVQVAAGAEVSDAVLFTDVIVEAGAVVSHAIVDECVRIGVGARVGGAAPDGPPAADDLVLIGRGSQVADGARIPPGARLEPGTT